MNCIFLWEMGLGEAGHDSREDTLMPQRPLISGSLRKKGLGAFHCCLFTPGPGTEALKDCPAPMPSTPRTSRAPSLQPTCTFSIAKLSLGMHLLPWL